MSSENIKTEKTKESDIKNARKFFQFIAASPTAFQACQTISGCLSSAGFEELSETSRWNLRKGGKYFIARNHSALLAFSIPENPSFTGHFHIIASHGDSPMLKIKYEPELGMEGAYVRLNVEKYGGLLMAPWFDRPLSIAGRVIICDGKETKEVLLDFGRDLVLIPSLAIHMDREVNNGHTYKMQKELLPVFALGKPQDSFLTLLQKELGEMGLAKAEILDYDLFVYNRMAGSVWGADNEFLSAPRLDDLMCVYGSLEGFLTAEKQESICVYAMLDNEEVGSLTRQGADSGFLHDTLRRIVAGLGGDEEDFYISLAKSFLLSADNAHALHPAFPDTADPVQRPLMNGGIVIKYHAGQKYCTDAVSGAFVRMLCKTADVPYQVYINHSNIAGGSTLGNISTSQAAIRAADIGLAQLAMHSCYETAGTADLGYLARLSKEFFR